MLLKKIKKLFMDISKSLNCCLIHKICAQQLSTAVYSALTVESLNFASNQTKTQVYNQEINMYY